MVHRKAVLHFHYSRLYHRRPPYPSQAAFDSAHYFRRFGGLTMAIYCPLLIYLNNAKLPKELRPSWFTNSMMVLISGFFLYFAVKVIQQQFFS